jgi:hypothetical protein
MPDGGLLRLQRPANQWLVRNSDVLGMTAQIVSKTNRYCGTEQGVNRVQRRCVND